MAGVVVHLDEGAIRAFVAAPDGPIARWLMTLGELVKRETIANLREGFPQDFLGPTIVKRWVANPTGPRMQVGSDHTQTQAHIIRGNPLLFFVSTKGPTAGHLISKHMVNHPGSNFDAYLGDKLQAALAAIRGAL